MKQAQKKDTHGPRRCVSFHTKVELALRQSMLVTGKSYTETVRDAVWVALPHIKKWGKGG